MGAHKACPVRFDGSFRQSDFLRNLGIGLALGYQSQNLLLSIGDQADVSRHRPVCWLETIKRLCKWIGVIAASPPHPAPEAGSIPPPHQAFIVIDLTASKIASPHLAGTNEISDFGIQPAETLIDQLQPFIAKNVSKFGIAIPYDTVCCIDHRDWQFR